ncbi:unnamed protein product [Thlaspi arvense]|uniref:NAC domain-containing protein n=1 Tax=Thlaspi arvense TaxID=13288 RepID=A0AAU9RV77_THLAR|nr:unnamed protein product [Thlaspi arvense]
MDDRSVSSDEDDDLIEPADEVIISYYLLMMMNNGKSWPNHFLRDLQAHVYNLNPWSFFNTQNAYYYVFAKGRTEACGKTDGCASGCWRIMARDKLIKSEETGKFLGFKKILKFCDKEEEEDERNWVMEEYRLVNKRKQDQVICKIRLLLQREVNSLLATHFSFLNASPLSDRLLMPKWDYCVRDEPKDETISLSLHSLIGNIRNDWPRRFPRGEKVYSVEPWRIVGRLHTSLVLNVGHYFFVNKTETCGRTDGCNGGCWRMIRRDKVIISKRTKKVLGFKRFYKFCHSENPEFAKPVLEFEDGEEVKVTWVMEEYRIDKKRMQGRVICRIRALLPEALARLIRYAEVEV